ncbi:hypothetical protein IX317_000072 [Fusobacterium sp. DD29]|uniref:penicillin-binding protein n=1 Tax=unclassified Fusobacterium TaxID=2648384 RepID=UPI001B8C7FA7|nr:MULTISPECIES: penicillin-binding protein [unclassified Fusobacterium]MBR8701171.1 hypothetical protein [Fusobacterium sp. DD45]MBR8711946.1 hypothetical protein [Fusobacterium sp. DD28]MBR8748415.1 hypothetical protein [Fusobacterium sp. DD29]MBR8752519.1 hypothetical protein [Fusobacterium sp. DD26]MBR8760611.1 hypothetical protein [Fusobacterium sp. DD25]
MLSIYDKTGKYKITLNYTKEEFKTSWYLDWTEGDLISETKLTNPIIDGGMIREMTREEMVQNDIEVSLVDGEYIENKKIKTVEKPNNKPYWNWNGKEWIFDGQKGKENYYKQIDDIKAQRLAYGFDYQGHRQRCRDKDVAFMVATITALQAALTLKKSKEITWYFEDNFGVKMKLEDMATLLLYGTSFIQSIYDTENFFKTGEVKEISSEIFEAKRRDVHKKLVG